MRKTKKKRGGNKEFKKNKALLKKAINKSSIKDPKIKKQLTIILEKVTEKELKAFEKKHPNMPNIQQMMCSQSGGADKCPICLGNLDNPRLTNITLECGHTYHQNCIKNHIENTPPPGNNHCPYCRTRVSMTDRQNINHRPSTRANPDPLPLPGQVGYVANTREQQQQLQVLRRDCRRLSWAISGIVSLLGLIAAMWGRYHAEDGDEETINQIIHPILWVLISMLLFSAEGGGSIRGGKRKTRKKRGGEDYTWKCPFCEEKLTYKKGVKEEIERAIKFYRVHMSTKHGFSEARLEKIFNDAKEIEEAAKILATFQREEDIGKLQKMINEWKGGRKKKRGGGGDDDFPLRRSNSAPAATFAEVDMEPKDEFDEFKDAKGSPQTEEQKEEQYQNFLRRQDDFGKVHSGNMMPFKSLKRDVGTVANAIGQFAWIISGRANRRGGGKKRKRKTRRKRTKKRRRKNRKNRTK